jgi:hypothetical protein
VPPLEPATPEERRRRAEAETRRAMRQETDRQVSAIRGR